MTRGNDRPKSYSVAGVDEEREQTAFASVMRPWLEKTRTLNQRVRSIAGIGSGHFATVMQIDGGPCIAFTTDGVGTKILVARAAGRYETVGIDCVANNVNDLICIGADPVALVDYIAIDVADEAILGALAQGLFIGADQAGISIPGGEIAQIGAMLAPGAAETGEPMFDLVGTAIGLLPMTPPGAEPVVVDGSAVRPGDVVIGLRSSGLHSNGYSLARHALFELAGHSLEDVVGSSGRTLADDLLEPTRIYVSAVRQLWEKEIPIHGMVNISGGGLLNLLRLPAAVGYRLDVLPEPHSVFEMIQAAGKVPAAEMYSTFNMGVGAAIVVPPDSVDEALMTLKAASEDPLVLGVATDAAVKTVELVRVGLSGQGDVFQAVD